DSAGLIHPLCGNGMAMAIKSAQIFSELFLASYLNSDFNRNKLERIYTTLWKNEFDERLKFGRVIQKILLNPVASRLGFSIAGIVPKLLPILIAKTHGKPIA